MFTRHFAHWPPGLPRTLEVKDGFAHIPDSPGTGVGWDEKAVKKYSI